MREQPVRIQLRRAKGWRMPPNTVKVDRSTKWGNLFVVGQHGTAEECVRSFTFLCGGLVCMCDTPSPERQQQYLAMLRADIEELRGKNIGCWCGIGKPCHGDVLLHIANRRRKP